MSCKTELLSLIILSCLDVTLVLGGITPGEMTCGPGGTPIHYLYGYVPPKGVVSFEAPDLERGIHFRGVF